MLVNGMAVKKNSSCTLHSGDEVVFGIAGDHAYVSLFFGGFVSLINFIPSAYHSA